MLRGTTLIPFGYEDNMYPARATLRGAVTGALRRRLLQILTGEALERVRAYCRLAPAAGSLNRDPTTPLHRHSLYSLVRLSVWWS